MIPELLAAAKILTEAMKSDEASENEKRRLFAAHSIITEVRSDRQKRAARDNLAATGNVDGRRVR